MKPRLIDVTVPENPRGAVLVLHGGASRQRRMAVSPTQLSVLRMIPIARALAQAGKREVAVFRLLNSHRGWDTTHTPVHDAHWALDGIAERIGVQVPVCLVGHSLGGRAAILAAPRPEVRSAVALAPWVYETDLPRGIDRQRLLIVHGSHDRVASPRRSAALAQRLAAFADVSYVLVDGGSHAMLRHHKEFTGHATRFAVETLRPQATTSLAA